MEPFNATTRQAFNSHTSDNWDAIFRVEVAGVSHAVFASYNGQGDWSQWGAPREALAANVETVTAWAAALYENGRDALDAGEDAEDVATLTGAGWERLSDGWSKTGGIPTPGPAPEGMTTAEALAFERGD